MNLTSPKTRIVVALLLLTACSRDPEKLKVIYFASGEKYAHDGKYPEAVIQFRNAIKLDPRFARAHHQLARLYVKLKSTQQAYQEFVNTVELDPDNRNAQLELATLLIEARKFDDAEKAVEKVIQIEPRNARAHALLGKKHVMLNAWPRAIAEFQKAIDLDPKQIDNYAGIGLALASSGRIDEAEASLQRATEVQPSSSQALLNLGQFHLMQHRLGQAEAELNDAATADPTATLPRILLVKAYIESGNLASAERVASELKKLAPDRPDGYTALASFYETTGQTEKAVTELQSVVAAKPKDVALKAHLTDVLIGLQRMADADRLNQDLLAANPGDPRGLASRGRILIDQQKYAEAKAVLDQAVQFDPRSASSHYFLGVAESFLGLSQLAKASFTQALDLSPGMADATAALAELSFRAADYDNALRQARIAIQSNPRVTLAYVVASKVFVAKGNLSQAGVQIRSALDLDPEFLPAIETMLEIDIRNGSTQVAVKRMATLASKQPRNAKLKFLLGVAYLKQNDLNNAEQSVMQAIAIDRKTPDAFGLLAEINRARGDLNQSVTWYKAAIAENPKKVENYMALSDIYQMQGKWEAAKEQAEHAYALDPSSPFIANNLAYLYLEHGGDINMALSLAQNAKRNLPDSPIVYDTIGWAFYKLRAPEAAVAQLAESVRRAPDNSTYHYHLGMAYIAAGRLSHAALSLQQALTVDPHFPDAGKAKAALDQIVLSR